MQEMIDRTREEAGGVDAPVRERAVRLDVLLGKPRDLELLDELIERHPMEIVELRPPDLAVAYLVHHRLVKTAPRDGELQPVDGELVLTPERLALTRDARAPIHDRSEHVE